MVHKIHLSINDLEKFGEKTKNFKDIFIHSKFDMDKYQMDSIVKIINLTDNKKLDFKYNTKSKVLVLPIDFMVQMGKQDMIIEFTSKSRDREYKLNQIL